MGKTRLLAVIAALLIVAILGVLLLPGNEAQPQPKEEKEPTVTVTAAKTEIPAYTFITADMLYTKEVPESSVHANYITDPQAAVGMRSLVNIAPDEVIMSNHIIDENDPANRLAYNIAEGMRAATVPVDDASGVCDQIRAGDYVDVAVVVQEVEKEDENDRQDDEQNAVQKTDTPRMVSVMLLQNVKVLALDQDRLYAPQQSDGTYYYRYVTLEVAPEDPVKLFWAQYEGRIYLALRGEDDDSLTERELYGAEKALMTEGEEQAWQ